jgi:release factor glutamine methyltransferase
MTMASDSVEAVWTISRLIAWTTEYFEANGIDSPRMTAEMLLAHSLAVSRIDLYLYHDKPLTSDELAGFKTLIRRRIKREPAAYITGSRGFWSLELDVNPYVLIPRPDTECLVEQALSVIPEAGDTNPWNIVDLGTGSGAIILALASERPGHRYFAVDLSMDAVVTARQNNLTQVSETHVSFVNGSWLDSFRKGPVFDMIVSNPPYIPKTDIDGLEPEVSVYEPRLALDGDTDGLFCLRHIAESASDYLRPGGILMMEMGFDQKESVRDIFKSVPSFGTPEFHKDFAGHDRMVKARKTEDFSMK